MRYRIGNVGSGLGPELLTPEAATEMHQWDHGGWPLDKLRTAFSLDARVRIVTRDRAGCSAHALIRIHAQPLPEYQFDQRVSW